MQRRVVRYQINTSFLPCLRADAAAEWIEANVEGVGKVTGSTFHGSSGWSSAYVYSTESGQKFFVKSSQSRDDSMFKGEALGLQAMYGEG
jgi:protein-ribulosamine 3-kinase